MRNSSSIKVLFVVGALSLGVGACATHRAEGESPVASAHNTGPTETELASSPRVAAAEGSVTVSDAGNNNTGVDLNIKHLARPQRVDPSASTYIVWAKPLSDYGRPQSLGALNVDQELNAKLSTTTPFRDFELFVTAESSPQVQDPRGERLLWATVSQR